MGTADLHNLIEVLPTPALLLSRDSSVSATNKKLAALVGLKPDELIGRSLCSLVADPPEKVERYLRQWMRSGQLTPAALSFKAANGELLRCRCEGAMFRPAAVTGQMFLGVVPRKGSESKFAGLNQKIAALNLEIRGAKEMEAALRRSNEELQRFAFVASHDMREPLRIISVYAQLLDQRYGDTLDANAREYLNFLVAAVQRISGLIDGLLEYSLVVNSRDAVFDRVDTDRVLQEVRFRLQRAIEETGAQIVWDGLPAIHGDTLGLTQLFQNVISNALKYRSSDPPMVEISASETSREWMFAVRDNGIGIDPQYHERIFEIFRRLHGPDLPGSGLGLSICRGIVERHGGRMWVDSKAGTGATFYFTLPKTAPAPSAAI